MYVFVGTVHLSLVHYLGITLILTNYLSILLELFAVLGISKAPWFVHHPTLARSISLLLFCYVTSVYSCIWWECLNLYDDEWGQTERYTLFILWLTVGLCLLAGTFSAISNKVLYDFKAVGRCGYHTFEKPYFLTLCMFIGESMCLLAFWAVQWFVCERAPPLDPDARLHVHLLFHTNLIYSHITHL